MKTIAVISQKGGAGKTTLAINLAGAAEEQGLSPVIIDLDPQASAKIWAKLRGKESPIVICTVPKMLGEAIATAREHGADVCIIDTAPHSETAALEAAKAADMVLIPCRPSMIDLQAVSTTVDIVKLAGRPEAMFLINCVRPGDKTLPSEAAAALQKHGIPVCDLRLTLRSDCIHALSAGQGITEFAPASPAAEEIRQLFKLSFHQGEKVNSHQDIEEKATA